MATSTGLSSGVRKARRSETTPSEAADIRRLSRFHMATTASNSLASRSVNQRQMHTTIETA